MVNQKEEEIKSFTKKVKTLRNSMEFSHGMRRALVSALALVYFISLGFDIIWITTLFAISTIIMIFFEFPTGAIADYDSRKKSMMISFFLIFVSFLGIFLFKQFWVLVGFWILNDIAWTFTSGAGSAWAIDALKYAKQKSKLVKLISQGYFSEKFGHVIGGLIGFFVVAINFRFVWLLISLIYLGLFFIIGKYMEERNFKPEKVPHNYLKKSLIKAKESFQFIIHKKNRELRVLLLGGAFGVLAISLFFVTVPLFITETLNLNPEYISLIFSFIAVITMLGPFLAERLANKKGFRYALFFAWALISASMFIFSIPHAIVWAIVGLSIMSFAEVINDIIEDSARHHEFSSKLRASLVSTGSIIWAITNSLGIFFAGLGIKFLGILPVIFIAGGISFLTALIYLFGMKR